MLAILVGTGAILSLALDVSRQVEQLAIANTQSAQWTMAQADVEFLAFIISTFPEEGQALPDLEAMRRRHDIFYGRVAMLKESNHHPTLLKLPDYVEGLNALSQYLTEVTPYFDGPDEGLIAALPMIRDKAEAVRPDLRYITLSSQRELAKESDRRRHMASATLQQIAALTLLMISALVSLIIGMGVLLRRVRSNADREAMTHARMRAIIHASIDSILAINPKGIVTEANRAAELQFGRGEGELLGKDVAQLITSINADGTRSYGLPPPGPRYTRIDTIHLDGSRHPAECSVAETTGDDELFRVCFVHDIADRLEAERALTLARDRALAGEKSKADMLAVMSHEMRTPLNGILGTLDLVQDTRLTPLQREYMRIIRTSGDQLLGHVNDVLDISRLDAGKMSVARQPFELVPLLSDLSESQRPLAEAQGNRISLDLRDVHLWVEGDPQKLSQVLLNLVSNAAKFTRNGKITLSASRHEGGDLVTFSVTDSGIGIPSSELDRIFEEFVTLDATYGRPAEGTGLGLPISRRLVQVMGGDLTATSKIGLGSTFRFTIPLPRLPGPPQILMPPPAVQDNEATDLWRPLDILVVEDSPINRFVLRAMLEGDGHDVTEAHDGAEGLAAASERRFDLILMDIAMPGMDGTEATRRIRKSTGPSHDVPIVALTAHALPADLTRFQEAGMTTTLTKPLTRPKLRETIQLTHATSSVADQGQAAALDTVAPISAMLDHEQTENLRSGLGSEVFARLLDRYIAETTAEIAYLQQNFAESPAQELADRSHTIAGSAAIFGAQSLRQELITLEQALRELDDEVAEEALGRLSPLWVETREALLLFHPAPKA